MHLEQKRSRLMQDEADLISEEKGEGLMLGLHVHSVTVDDRTSSVLSLDDFDKEEGREELV